MRFSFLLAAAALGFQGCSTYLNEVVHAGSEPAITPGMMVRATNSYGTITIKAIGPRTREYRWDDHRVTVRLQRRSYRWYGSLGLYSVGASWLVGRNRVQVVAEDAQFHASSLQEAVNHLAIQPGMNWVSNSQGYVVGFNRAIDPNGYGIANVEVWRFFTNGKPMKNLPFRNDAALRVSQLR